MTVQEFKIKYPQYANLEGEALWNMMEDTLFSENTVYHKENSDIQLTPEEEVEYQKAKTINDNFIDGKVLNYTRAWWKTFDQVVTPIKKESYYFMIFDVSTPESTRVWDTDGNEYSSIDALMTAVDEKRKAT